MIAARILLESEWAMPVVRLARQYDCRVAIADSPAAFACYGAHVVVNGDPADMDRFHADVLRLGVRGSMWDCAAGNTRAEIPIGPRCGGELGEQLEGLYWRKALTA